MLDAITDALHEINVRMLQARSPALAIRTRKERRKGRHSSWSSSFPDRPLVNRLCRHFLSYFSHHIIARTEHCVNSIRRNSVH